MKVMYTTKAVSTGGRDGQVFVENTPLKYEMASPAELGGKKAEGVNPEQLFAAGYASCYGSALQHVFRERKLDLPPAEVHATVGIGKNDAGGFQLAVELEAVIRGVDQAAADALAQEAHFVCPYSNATRGNIDVKVTARAV